MVGSLEGAIPIDFMSRDGEYLLITNTVERITIPIYIWLPKQIRFPKCCV
jgi:hypothetical protein